MEALWSPPAPTKTIKKDPWKTNQNYQILSVHLIIGGGGVHRGPSVSFLSFLPLARILTAWPGGRKSTLHHWVVITSAECQLKSKKPSVPWWFVLHFWCFSCRSSMPWWFKLFFSLGVNQKNNSPPEIWHHFLPVFGEPVFVWAGTWKFTSVYVCVWNWVGKKLNQHATDSQK